MPCDKPKTAKMYTKSGGRKSPPRLSKECRGQTRKGVDGRMWVSKKDSSGVYRWQRKTSRSRSRSRSRGRSPSRKTASTRGGRPCGTRTRGKCRWTREELERLAIAQGIPYDGVTMDALCDVLSFEDADAETVVALLGSANSIMPSTSYEYTGGIPGLQGGSPLIDHEWGIPGLQGGIPLESGMVGGYQKGYSIS